MKRASLTIHISPIPYLAPEKFSSVDEIRIIRSEVGPTDTIGNNYNVYYIPQEFAKLDPSVFGESLVNLLIANLPDTAIDINILHGIYESQFYADCAKNVIVLDDYLTDLEHPQIIYYTSDAVDRLFQQYADESGEFDLVDDEDDDDDVDELDIDPRIAKLLGKLQGSMPSDDESAFGIEGILSAGNNTKGKYYGSSRVLKNASKNPKKQFKRHGIIVADDKSAIKKDEKIIKAFLKDFIPGNSSWIKEYREEVLSRWMRMYVIPKKLLKKLEKKQHGKNSKKGSSSNKITKENAMNFTRKLLGNDSWNNPNK